ncbi:MAG TPA: TIGR00730 family Rossman fold protein [Solirubrobacteraceae bacterium]|jgi:hypothetical protein
MTAGRRPQDLDEELLAAELPSVVSEITDEQRVARMRDELAAGFEAMADVGRAVAVFGSARTPEGHPNYDVARRIGRELGAAGFTVITGGGPGAMEGAARGAQEAGARSVGLTIDLPFAEPVSSYLDRRVDFHYFFARKVMFVRYSSAFVVLPGGYGTLDELFESLTLIQTGKIRYFPVILVGTDFWCGLVDWLRDRLLAAGTISEQDLDLLRVTDSPSEAVAACVAAADKQWSRG